MLWSILSWMLVGVIVGALARVLTPGRQSLGLIGTMGLGIGGAFLGGLVSWLFTGYPGNSPGLIPWPGWILSTIGSVVILILMLMHRRRSTR